ncbi:MAG: hypothetical protein K6G01_08665 [Eubacterium sp.]|nr:hypothetical protein [Eubacterium sp.]
MTLYERIETQKSVSFIGMCKNAGKTTTLNQMIQKLHDHRRPVSLTSIGRDGESNDLVTNTVKPGIYVYRGTLVATAAKLLKFCDVTKEILDTTGIHTPMGEVVIFRALSDGFVQVAGPSLTTQMIEVSRRFEEQQGGMVLIDGALERKSISTRGVSDSTILCTGASYDKDISKVVMDTAYSCKLLTLPKASVQITQEELNCTEEKYIPLSEDGRGIWDAPQRKPQDLWAKKSVSTQEKVPKALYVQGGLTDAMIRPLLVSNADLSGKRMIFRDGSRILLTRDIYEKLYHKGLRFEVMDAIRLLAVTINPFSAYGFHFDADEFYERMSAAVDVPVYNVRKEKEEMA